MSLFRLFLSAFFLAVISLAVGCSLFEPDDLGDDNLPPPTVEPLDGGVPGGFGDSMAPPPEAEVDEQGWSRAAMQGLNLPTIYFAYDQDRIGTSERAKLEHVAEYMLAHPVVGVVVQGHCDERGSEEYNRALGERRAISVKEYLISLGVPANRLRTQSFGEEMPAIQGKDESAWVKNRRAELEPHRIQ